MVVLPVVTDLVIGTRGVLLAIQALTVWRLGLDGAWALLGSWRRCGLRSRRALENSGILHERLVRDRVTGVVRRAIVLVVLRVVVRERGWVALLRTLATGLRLAVGLRALRQRLRRLGVSRRKAGSTVGLLRSTMQAFDVIVTHAVPVETALATRIRIVEIL